MIRPSPPPEPEANGAVHPATPATDGTPLAGSTAGVRQLFSQLQVRREPSGKVVIEAPAEAAGELGALFEGMAALLQSIARQ